MDILTQNYRAGLVPNYLNLGQHKQPEDLFSFPDVSISTTTPSTEVVDNDLSLPSTSKAYALYGPINNQERKTLTKKSIVLDMDETLVHTFPTMNWVNKEGIFTNPLYADIATRAYRIDLRDVSNTRGQGQRDQMWGVFRPHVKEFLLFCNTYFNVVALWSAGEYGYVHAVVDKLFSDIPRPHVILTRDNCNMLGKSCDKDLGKLYRDEHIGNFLQPQTTMIVDDRRDYFMASSPQNGILIPPYRPPETISGLRSDDMALLKLKDWFLQPQVQNAPDVRSLNKTRIFI